MSIQSSDDEVIIDSSNYKRQLSNIHSPRSSIKTNPQYASLQIHPAKKSLVIPPGIVEIKKSPRRTSIVAPVKSELHNSRTVKIAFENSLQNEMISSKKSSLSSDFRILLETEENKGFSNNLADGALKVPDMDFDAKLPSFKASSSKDDSPDSNSYKISSMANRKTPYFGEDHQPALKKTLLLTEKLQPLAAITSLETELFQFFKIFNQINFSRTLGERICCAKLDDLNKISRLNANKIDSKHKKYFITKIKDNLTGVNIGKEFSALQIEVIICVLIHPSDIIRAAVENNEYKRLILVILRVTSFCCDRKILIKKACGTGWHENNYIVEFVKIIAGVCKAHFLELASNPLIELSDREIATTLKTRPDKYIHYFYSNQF